MKAFVRQFSDLSGPTNPKGIWSTHFLALKQALDRGDDAENVLQALTNWLQIKGVTGVNAILELEPEQALEALVQKLGAGMDAKQLPPVALQTLRRTIQRLASKHIAGREAELDRERSSLAAMRSRFQLEAQQVVDKLLR